MRVALDVDGVVAKTISLMTKIIKKQGFSVTFSKYNPCIDGIENNKKFIKNIVNDVFTNRMHQIEPYDSLTKALSLIYKNLGQITFVTARREEFNRSTLVWLNNYCTVPFKLVNKRSAEKCQFILDNNFDVFVEDRLRTANEAAELGIKTYLINREWNIDRFPHKDVIRVNNLMEFYLKEKENKNEI